VANLGDSAGAVFLRQPRPRSAAVAAIVLRCWQKALQDNLRRGYGPASAVVALAAPFAIPLVVGSWRRGRATPLVLLGWGHLRRDNARAAIDVLLYLLLLLLLLLPTLLTPRMLLLLSLLGSRAAVLITGDGSDARGRERHGAAGRAAVRVDAATHRGDRLGLHLLILVLPRALGFLQLQSLTRRIQLR